MQNPVFADIEDEDVEFYDVTKTLFNLECYSRTWILYGKLNNVFYSFNIFSINAKSLKWVWFQIEEIY